MSIEKIIFYSGIQSFKHIVLMIVIFISCCLIGYGQPVNIPSSDTTSALRKQSVNYFKIEIGLHIMDCPVLPMNLKSKLMEFKGIKDYNADVKKQCILFNVPVGVTTKDQVEAIAIASGFPKESIKVLMDTKPFAN